MGGADSDLRRIHVTVSIEGATLGACRELLKDIKRLETRNDAWIELAYEEYHD